MKKSLFALLAAGLLMGSCSSVPVTGRKQLLLVSDAEVLSASLTQYNSFIASAPRSSSTTQSATVTRVGRRIADACETYLRQNGLEAEISNFAWEFNLVKDDQINAFCMPGGKIVVYEGLMNIVGSEDELAVVVGHEVAHAVAKHSNEQMSQEILAQYGAGILNASLSQKSQITQVVAAQVYGLGSQYAVALPFSRKHEVEADYMGLVFMTMAGYNPDVALNFWQKMSASSGGKTPEFLSTHPSDEKRIRNIQNDLAEIKAKYGRKQTAGTSSSFIVTEKGIIRK